ncbi:MAG: GldM family protein [Saprospiraceae bacterium]
MNIYLFILFIINPLSNLPEFKNSIPETMYIGVENQIVLRLNGSDPESVNVKCNVGSIHKRDDSTYAFYPQYPVDDFKIKLYYKKVLCEVKTVNVKNIPDLTPRFEKETNNTLRISDVSSIDKLIFDFPDDFPAELKSTITSFNFYLFQSNGVAKHSATIRSDGLDEAAKIALGKIEKGDRILINNVFTQNPRSGNTRINVNKEIVILD